MRPFPASMLLASRILTSGWNPADKSAAVTLSNVNKTATGTISGDQGVRGTAARSSGKLFFEATVNANPSGSNSGIGISDATATLASLPGTNTNSAGYRTGGGIAAKGANVGAFSSYTTGDVIQVAVDLTGGHVYFGKNGTYQGSQNPVAGTGGVAINAASYMPHVDLIASGVQFTINTGDFAFLFGPPSGFTAWG